MYRIWFYLRKEKEIERGQLKQETKHSERGKVFLAKKKKEKSANDRKEDVGVSM